MGNPVPGWIFGGFLTVLGVFLLHAQRGVGARIAAEAASDHERKFMHNRARRRTQVAGMILLIGIMIPVGDSLIQWQKAPMTFAIYWMIVLGLALWTMLLGFADLASTRLHTSVELGRLRRQREGLERAAQQLREEQAKRQENRS